VEGGWTEGALIGIKLNTIKPLPAKKPLRRGAEGLGFIVWGIRGGGEIHH